MGGGGGGGGFQVIKFVFLYFMNRDNIAPGVTIRVQHLQKDTKISYLNDVHFIIIKQIIKV